MPAAFVCLFPEFRCLHDRHPFNMCNALHHGRFASSNSIIKVVIKNVSIGVGLSVRRREERGVECARRASHSSISAKGMPRLSLGSSIRLRDLVMASSRALRLSGFIAGVVDGT
jgi:hypothetical protein